MRNLFENTKTLIGILIIPAALLGMAWILADAAKGHDSLAVAYIALMFALFGLAALGLNVSVYLSDRKLKKAVRQHCRPGFRFDGEH